ncbi:hypothetical protein COTS27_00573 [Spirochaetota bacterium]|nr:hypothetical protein COTS27_00573 [Spirochaetota bacterium]
MQHRKLPPKRDFYEMGIDKIFFIDIETVGESRHYEDLHPTHQELWRKKAENLMWYSKKYQNQHQQMIDKDAATDKNAIISDVYQKEAGIHSEFGKIVCISIGFLMKTPSDAPQSNTSQSNTSQSNAPQSNPPLPNNTPQSNNTAPSNTAFSLSFRVNSFYGTDEKEILNRFYDTLEKYSDYYLCAHNGFNFDFPFICRRSIIHHMSLPYTLQIIKKRPWDTYWLLDTMDLWQFNGRKNFTSLETLAHVLDFPSPKNITTHTKSSSIEEQSIEQKSTEQKIDGSAIHNLYYDEQDFETIRKYCERDCLAVAQIVLRLRELPTIKPDNVFSVIDKATAAADKGEVVEHPF